jgi:hypothetical protein
LTTINSHFHNPHNYIGQFEALKIPLRGYGVRDFSDRQMKFEEEVSNVLKLKMKLEEELKSIDEIKGEITESEEEIRDKVGEIDKRFEAIEEELERIIERKDALIIQVSQLSTKNEEIYAIREQARELLEDIKESQSEVKSNEKLISQFANQVEERTKRLTKLEQNTDENNQKLNDYEEERRRIIDESQELIDSARQALNYKTAEGVSESFQEQYGKSSAWWVVSGWVVGAVLCLIGTLILGLLIVNSKSSDPLMVIIGRISLLPIPIIGAFFCARQYNKQKNIIEDYAYKMVLAKSIVGFSDQLKSNASDNNEEYVHYIKTALEEIHKDPLRSRKEKRSRTEKNSTNLNELVELAEKIVNIAKPAD